MELKKFVSTALIFMLFSLSIILFREKTGKVTLPIDILDTPDAIPSVIIINVSEDTWVGNDLLPGGCQSSPCSNGEQFCEKNCTFSHGGCRNVGGTFIWVGKGSGSSSSGTCGIYDSEKHAYLWFNMSEAKTSNGNNIQIPWYLIKNATIKLWVNTSSNCQNISLRTVLPNDNKNTVNEIIHDLVYNTHYYFSGGQYVENSTFFGPEIQYICPAANTTSELNITDYLINQTRYDNDVFVQLKAMGDFVPGGWSVSFCNKEHTNETLRPYLQIELNSIVCGDGYCTLPNETFFNCPADCSPNNYIEVNGTTFIQPEAINITGWSSNSSAYTYLWNNYNGTFQMMLPTGNDTQTNITLSSNLNAGTYNVSCNSTGNSTLASKIFIVATTTTTTVPPSNPPSGSGGGGGGGGSIKNTTTTTTTTTTSTTTTTTTTSTTTLSPTTTTTIIQARVWLNFSGKTPIWIGLITIIILVVIVAIFYFVRRREKLTIIDVKLDDYGYDYE